MVKIGVISDTHGDLNCWQRARRLWGDVDAILHCGDVLSHPESAASFHLAEEIKSLDVPLYISRGNCDKDGDFLRLGQELQDQVRLRLMGRSILVSHGHDFSYTREMALFERPDMVVTGHTHVASLVRDGGIVYLNPGSASAPRGRDPASIAIVTEEEISIVTLEGFMLHSERW